MKRVGEGVYLSLERWSLHDIVYSTDITYHIHSIQEKTCGVKNVKEK